MILIILITRFIFKPVEQEYPNKCFFLNLGFLGLYNVEVFLSSITIATLLLY